MSFQPLPKGGVVCTICSQAFFGKLTVSHQRSHIQGKRHQNALSPQEKKAPSTVRQAAKELFNPKARNETILPRKTAKLLLTGKLIENGMTLPVEVELEVCQRTGVVHVRRIEYDS